MRVDSIDKLFIEELKDLYSAENQITKALPKMVNAASSMDLKKAFESHLRETEGQIERLVQICNILGTSPKGKSCEGMKGVLDEGSSMLHESAEGDVRDAALISAAQRVEHYEMAAYGTVRTYAQLLGQAAGCQTSGRNSGRGKGGRSETDFHRAEGQWAGAATCLMNSAGSEALRARVKFLTNWI